MCSGHKAPESSGATATLETPKTSPLTAGAGADALAKTAEASRPTTREVKAAVEGPVAGTTERARRQIAEVLPELDAFFDGKLSNWKEREAALPVGKLGRDTRRNYREEVVRAMATTLEIPLPKGNLGEVQVAYAFGDQVVRKLAELSADGTDPAQIRASIPKFMNSGGK